jgi:hypothetical protein
MYTTYTYTLQFSLLGEGRKEVRGSSNSMCVFIKKIVQVSQKPHAARVNRENIIIRLSRVR